MFKKCIVLATIMFLYASSSFASISSETIRNNYIGNGVLDTYPFEFIIYDQDEIDVYVDGVLQSIDVNFTISAADIEDDDGGDVVFGASYIPDNGSVITIISAKPYTQETSLSLSNSVYEQTYDKSVIEIKQLKEKLDRTLQLPIESTETGLTFPEPVAEYYLRWKSDLSGLENVVGSDSGSALGPMTLADVAVTISVGVIVVSSGPAHYIVDTEGAAASDTLDRVTGLDIGDIFTISAANDARTVIVNSGGYIQTTNGLYCWLDDSVHEMLFRMGQGGVAYELSRSTGVGKSGDNIQVNDGYLGSAATRDAEDTMTDGSNLPDGAAVKAYGDANWGTGLIEGDFVATAPLAGSVNDVFFGTGTKVTISISADSIGDAQLEFDTGQILSTVGTPQHARMGLGIAADGTGQLKIGFDAAAYTIFTQANGGAFTIAAISDGTDEIRMTTAGNEEFSLTDAGLQLGGANARVNEISTDGTLAGDSDIAVPTEKAVKAYVDAVSPATTWIGLTDTDPANFTGSGGKFSQVNVAPDGLEFSILEEDADGNLTLGDNGDDDLTINFDSNTTDGYVKWMEDEGHFALSHGLQLSAADAIVTEFSIDGTLAGNSDTAVPTEKAVKAYVDAVSPATTWIGLTDTDPANYVGSGGKFSQVNATPDALEFSLLEEDADGNLTLGDNGDDDLTINFDSNTTDGYLKWMEDEGHLALSHGLQLSAANAIITEFSIDGTLAGDSDAAVPTEKAVKAYVDGIGAISTWIALSDTDPANYAGSEGQFVKVNQSPDGLEFGYLVEDAAGNVALGADGDVNHTLTFDANSNDGVITWQEDEDLFMGNFNVFNIQAYGATPNDASDDTAEIQTAIDAAIANGGGKVWFPAGYYEVSDDDADGNILEVIMDDSTSIMMAGVGSTDYGSRLKVATGNNNDKVIFIQGVKAVVIRDLAIRWTDTNGEAAAQTSGAVGIYVTDDAADNDGTQLHNVRVLGGYYGVHFLRAAGWRIDSCIFQNASSTGLLMENQFNSDSGEAAISNSRLMANGYTATAAVIYKSGGGAKFSNNKFLAEGDQGIPYLLYIDATEHGGSGGLNSWLVTGNGFESAGEYGIYIKPASVNPSKPVTINITGNEIKAGIKIDATAADQAYNITISGNVMTAADHNANNAYIELDNCYNVTITGNDFRKNARKTYAVEITNSNNIFVMANQYYGWTTDPLNGSGFVSNIVNPLTVGLHDVVQGVINAAGPISGNEGGEFRAYTSAPNDSVTNYWAMDIHTTSLRWWPNNDSSKIMILDTSGNLDVTGTIDSATLNTGQGATEIYDMNQDVRSDDAVTFLTVNTGQGANELYDMNQNVQTTDSPTFASPLFTGNPVIGIEGGGERSLHIKGSDAASGGSKGGQLLQYIANDYDGTYNYWLTRPDEDDLTWGPTGTIRMKLEAGGDLYIDGTYYDTGASLDYSLLEGPKKWALMNSLIDAYRNHDLKRLDKALKHTFKKNKNKKEENRDAKSLNDLIQLQAECIMELRADLDNLINSLN